MVKCCLYGIHLLKKGQHVMILQFFHLYYWESAVFKDKRGILLQSHCKFTANLQFPVEKAAAFLYAKLLFCQSLSYVHRLFTTFNSQFLPTLSFYLGVVFVTPFVIFSIYLNGCFFLSFLFFFIDLMAKVYPWLLIICLWFVGCLSLIYQTWNYCYHWD